MIPVIESYKSQGVYGRPNTDINPKLKDKDYGRQWATYLYSLYCQNQTAWGYADTDRFNTNRRYSTGTQDSEQYKSFLLNEVRETTTNGTVSVQSWDDVTSSARSKRMGWHNINWKNLSPAPAIMNMLHGHLDKIDFDLYVDTIDADSRGLKEDAKYKKMVEAKYSDWQIDFKKKAGIPVDEEMAYPMTQEEFDMIEAEDGFKLAVATTMQKLVRHSFEVSRWDNVVRKKVVDDLVCLGYGAVKDYYDATERKWKVKYLNPSYLVAQYSNEFDYHDSDYFGYLHTDWTISRIREKVPDLKEEDVLAMASKSYDKYGNNYSSTDWSNISKLDPSTGTYKNLNGIKIPVFEAWWMDYDTEKSLYYRNRHGRDLVIPLGHDGEVRPVSEESKQMGATQDVKKKGLRIPRECYWILDTDIVFNYGQTAMPSMDNTYNPRSPFHVEQLLQPPIIENIIPILDEITILYLRYQNSLAMMVERGYTINTAMLSNVNLGGDTLNIGEVIKMWHQTGRLLYSYQNQQGVLGMYGGGAATPVTEIAGGLGTRVDETIKSMEFAFKKLEYFAGISLAALGVTPEPNVPEETVKQGIQMTQNSLKPLIDAALEIKQRAGECMMLRIQAGIRNSQEVRDSYSGVVSPTEIEQVRLMEDSHVQYGMNLKPKPDAAMKTKFSNWLTAALQDTRDGNTGLYTDDAMYFEARLAGGEDILELIKQVRYRIRKNREQKEQADMRQSQAQTEGQMQMQAQGHQLEMEKLQTEGQMKIQEEIIRGEIKNHESDKQIMADLYQRLQEEAIEEQGITRKGGK